MNILLGVTGGIAAYKAAELANSLTKSGHSVRTIMTGNAQKFVTPLTFETLTKQPVYSDMWERTGDIEVEHIELAKWGELLLVAPATANYIAKAAAGIADDMLTTVMLAYAGRSGRVVICPAMNTAMYENPITVKNIQYLKSLGFGFVEPRVSALACGDTGKGALAETDTILSALNL